MDEHGDATDSLHVELTTEGATTVLRLRGELDLESASTLEAHFNHLPTPSAILVDLGELTFMDAHGLHMLLAAHRNARSQGFTFTVINVNPHLHPLLRLADVAQTWMLDDTAPPPSPRRLGLSMRDRLLLAFANLNSYGIAARPHMPGNSETAHRHMAGELQAKHPHGLRSYVFWLATDAMRFGADGSLAPSTHLPLHYSDDELVPAVIAACADMGIEISRDRRRRTLLARDGQTRRDLDH